MRKRRLSMGVLALVMIGASACTPPGEATEQPGLAPRGTTSTTVKPTRQDLSNKVSLTGKVTLSPTFGLVAPVAGQIRYLDVKAPAATPTKPTRVAGVWVSGKLVQHIEVPAGAVFTGRLVEDRSNVIVGMPVVSARHVGYGLVAELDGGQAYKISDAGATVTAQIKNGPGPFTCTVLGTIAALPPGTIPEPAPEQPATPPSGAPAVPAPQRSPAQKTEPSDATGLRLVCTAPADVRLINGAGATLEVVTEKATNVLVLPVEAVAGSQGKGKVDVVKPDRTRESRDVVLGLTDGKVIEIRSGLTGDEEVAVPAPNLPPGKDANPGGEPEITK